MFHLKQETGTKLLQIKFQQSQQSSERHHFIEEVVFKLAKFLKNT